MKIVLLPGLHGTDGLFKPLLETKPLHYDIEIISYDTNTKQDYSILTEIILKRLKKIKEKYIIVAESFSGPLALFISQNKPKNLEGIILVATFVTAPNYKIAQYLPWTVGFLLTKPLYYLRRLFTIQVNKKFIDNIAKELERTNSQVLAHRINAIFNVDAKEALSMATIPIAYFRGKNDIVVPKKNLDNILTIRNDIEVYYFESNHFLLQSMPNESWHKIITFIDKIKNNEGLT